VTAQPSPDLPDLYQEAAKAYSGTTADTPYVRGIGASDAFRAAVDRVAELVRAEYARPFDPEPILRRAEAATRRRDAEIEQRVRAELATMTEVARSNRRHVAMLSEYQDQLTADLAAMTARAKSAEARYDQARAQLAQMIAGRATWKAKALEMERARDLAEVDRDTLAAIQAHDGTGPETGPSATHSPQQATAEGQDPEGPQDDSGGAA
jgi:DNA-binding ferritin-like protein